MPRIEELRIDVTDAHDLGARVETAVSVHLPDPDDVRNPLVVVCAFPGATYDRSYFHRQISGRSGYSFATHLAATGIVVALCDHIGTGGSTPYEPFAALTSEVVVAADRLTTDGVLAAITDGRLPMASGAPPFVIGVGHSMGGYLLVRQQAQHDSFDALGVLGWSTALSPWTAERTARQAEMLALSPDRTWPARSVSHALFYGSGLPDDVVAADSTATTRTYSWVLTERPEMVFGPLPRATAAVVDVPLFLGFGEVDVSPDPYCEASSYERCRDITTFVLPEAAHCFNLAPTRQLFFHRFASWCWSIAETYGTPSRRRSRRV